MLRARCLCLLMISNSITSKSTSTSTSMSSSFGLHHSFVIRHSGFVIYPTSHFSRFGALDAFLLLIRPFKLDRVTEHLLKAPRANVTDFSIGIVIPTRTRDRIGDCFTQLVRTGRG